MILINAGTVAPGVANWPPKFDGIPFSVLGPIQGHKVQHLLVSWGKLKSSFLCRPWRDAKDTKRALSVAGFTPDSAALQGTACSAAGFLNLSPFLLSLCNKYKK
jgi:hypothetical protein